MRLSTSTNGVFYQRRNRYENFVPVEQCMEECAAAGFHVMDINCCDNADPGMPLDRDDWEQWVSRIARRAEQLGIRFSQSHNPIYNFCHPEKVDRFYWAEEMTRRSILCAGMLHVNWIVVHAGTSFQNGKIDEKETIQKNLDYYGKMTEFAVQSGCQGIAVENMASSPDHSQLCESTQGLIDLVDRFHSEHVGICWDFGHAHLTREDQVESLRSIGKRLKATHVADNSGKKDDHTLPMLGTVPWERIMPMLRQIDYQGDFTYEIHKYMWNAPACLRPSMLKFAVEVGNYLLKMAEQGEPNGCVD